MDEHVHGREFLTVTVTRYEELLETERKLAALEAGGVDNWEGYSEALRGFFDEDDEDF